MKHTRTSLADSNESLMQLSNALVETLNKVLDEPELSPAMRAYARFMVANAGWRLTERRRSVRSTVRLTSSAIEGGQPLCV